MKHDWLCLPPRFFRLSIRLLFLLLVWLIFSCDLLQKELQQPRKYRVNAPQFPSDWLAQNGLQFDFWQWQVEYFGTSYANQALIRRTEKHIAKRAYIQIDLKKQESAIVQVSPRFRDFPHDSSAAQWRPAGAQILWQNRNGDEYSQRYSISATWPEGFISHLLSRLLQAGFDIRYLNTEKLFYYIGRRLKTESNSTLPNPWIYDLPYLLGQLGRLEMNWYDIRLRKRIKIRGMPIFQIKGKDNLGRWQPLNVAQNIIDCSLGSCRPELGIGLHYYFELNSRKLWQLEVQKNGEVLGMPLH